MKKERKIKGFYLFSLLGLFHSCILEKLGEVFAIIIDAGVPRTGNPLRIRGYEGVNNYINGTEKNDIINGTEKNDLIKGLAGNDTINGGKGADVLNGGEGADILNGEEGIDAVSYWGSKQAVRVNLKTNTHSGGDAQGDRLSNIENIIGSDHDDNLVGDNNDNLINGQGGYDTIDGGEGHDIIEGGEGADTIDGGEGIDTVSYWGSKQAVRVNLKTNTHSGGDAQGDRLSNIENIIGSDHDDNLVGDNNDNVINGQRGYDTIDGGGGSDTIDGGKGKDTVSYENSSQAVNVNLATNSHSGGDAEGDSLVNIENIIGSDHDDYLVGNNDDNVINGGEGNDTVSYENSSQAVIVILAGNSHSGGDAERDSLVNIENIIGSDHDDYLVGNNDDNVINGGEGIDTVSYWGSKQAVRVNLKTNTHSGGDAQGDRLSNIENIIGSDHDDNLVGDNNDNVINGQRGYDTIDGGGGSDTIDGGKGKDTVSYENSSQAVNVNLATNSHSGGDAEGDSLVNIENIIGSDHDDYLVGNNDDNVINGGEGNDTVSYENSSQAVIVILAGNSHSGGDAERDSLVNIENIIGSDHDDYLVGNNDDNVINGGEGNDTVSYEKSTEAVIVNLASNTHSGGDAQGDSLVSIENIIGSYYDDTLTGDSNDNIIDGGGGSDTIDGGEGSDTVSYEFSLVAVNINLATDTHSGGDAQGDSLSNIENIIGSDYNDSITGDDNDNVINGGGGRDTIDGGGGRDTIDGGGGSDTVSYQSSTEGVNVNLATDTHSGGDAQGDSLSNIENIIGSDYSDSLTGDDNDNVINAGEGADTIDGGEGVDTISYESSTQAVNINLATNTHSGGDAEGDSLVSIENIIGSDYNDTLIGDSYDNIISGGRGADNINAGEGSDTIDGGEGIDTVSYENSSQAVNINLATNTHRGGDAQDDSLVSIENIIGSSYDDDLIGDDNDNVINAGGGSDTIDGGEGADTIDGGEGVDTISYESSTQAVNINLASNTHSGGDAQDDSLVSIENIIGSDYDDDLIGDDNNNVINAGEGSDNIDGGEGADTIDGGEGVDTISYENSSQAVNINLATNTHSGGDAQDDSLVSIENIIGSDYNDTLIGDSYDNIISGGRGSDTIDGGLGFDTLKTSESLDLTNLADNLLSNIEKIDITGMEGADNVLTLSSSEISALGGFDTGNGDTSLIVEGDSGDAVGTTDDWTANGTMDYDGVNYNLFEQGVFQLLIGLDIDISGIL